MSEEKNLLCPCRRVQCPRHGKCGECVLYHQENPKYPPACEKRKQGIKGGRDTAAERTGELRKGPGMMKARGARVGREETGMEMKKCDPESVCGVLDGLGIAYDRLEHPPVQTMEDCKSVEEQIGAPVCKNLFLQTRQGTEYFLLLLEGGKRFRTAEVSKRIGRSRLSFGSEDKLYELLGLRPGAISPMGLIHDQDREIRLLIDEDVLGQERIAVHPCVNTQTVAMSTRDFADVFLRHTMHRPVILKITGEAE